MSSDKEVASIEKSNNRGETNLANSILSSQAWNATDMRSLSKPTTSVLAQFGDLTLTEDTTTAKVANKHADKGGKVGDDKDWNQTYGNDKTNLGMPNAIDRGTVNMEVTNDGSMRTYQWKKADRNVDGSIRDPRVDSKKREDSLIGKLAHQGKLDVPAEDSNKSVTGKILKK